MAMGVTGTNKRFRVGVNSNNNATWGGIIGDIADQTDLINYIEKQTIRLAITDGTIEDGILPAGYFINEVQIDTSLMTITDDLVVNVGGNEILKINKDLLLTTDHYKLIDQMDVKYFATNKTITATIGGTGNGFINYKLEKYK